MTVSLKAGRGAEIIRADKSTKSLNYFMQIKLRWSRTPIDS
jgi:hypothetical protein